MISKEEIEKALKIFNELDMLDDIDFIKARKVIKEYIQQLEANNYEQNNIINSYIEEREKLIDKLEKRRKQNNDRYGMAIDNDEFPEMYEYSGQVKEDEYILKILKVEK